MADYDRAVLQCPACPRGRSPSSCRSCRSRRRLVDELNAALVEGRERATQLDVASEEAAETSAAPHPHNASYHDLDRSDHTPVRFRSPLGALIAVVYAAGIAPVAVLAAVLR